MAVSKRLRFEILRRDNHACRYCGRSAPEVELTVDHVVPVALGGSDDPTNLVAACRDCNSGKSSVPADAAVVADVAQDALRWAKAMDQAAAERAADQARAQELHRQFIIEWEAWTDGRGRTTPKPGAWPATVDQFLNAGLSMKDLHELITVAMEAKAGDTWRYFCGCCWKRIGQLQERAKEILMAEPESGEPKRITLVTRWSADEIEEYISSNERYGSKFLSADSLESSHCEHRGWAEGDCGDLMCRLVRALRVRVS